jgi:acetyl-CoA C-acetyltransferase
VQEVIMGCVLQAGLGQNPARQTAIHAGVPSRVPALTVNKVCGSGLKAVILAAQAIRCSDVDVAVAGGMESMSNAPYLLPDARRGTRLGNTKLIDHMIQDGLWDVFNNFHMGESCELACEKYGVSREDMDRFALESHGRAVRATKEGLFREEIVPVQIGGKTVDKDEQPREDTSFDALKGLKSSFRPTGLVSAGNSSGINDGASALVLASEDKVRKGGLKPMARIVGYASGGMEPKWVMMAPIDALSNLEKKWGIKIEDQDLVEINEAFAGSTVALIRELKLDPAKVNVNGGAVALGHPIGCSGARILTTLLWALRHRGLKRGVATLCLGGGNAVALAVELL